MSGRTVVLVDDGLATGFTARATIHLVRGSGRREVVLAVPDRSGRNQLRGLADAVVCLVAPRPFLAIGKWYDDFGQVGDKT